MPRQKERPPKTTNSCRCEELKQQLVDAQYKLDSVKFELRGLEYIRLRDNQSLLDQRDEIQEKTLLRTLDYLYERLKYMENVEGHEALSADWDHPYQEGQKAGALRVLALAIEWVRQELKSLKEEEG